MTSSLFNDLLPGEMKSYVFSFLPAEELIKCMQVCRDWRSIIDSERFWKSIFENKTGINYLSSLNKLKRIFIAEHPIKTPKNITSSMINKNAIQIVLHSPVSCKNLLKEHTLSNLEEICERLQHFIFGLPMFMRGLFMCQSSTECELSVECGIGISEKSKQPVKKKEIHFFSENLSSSPLFTYGLKRHFIKQNADNSVSIYARIFAKLPVTLPKARVDEFRSAWLSKVLKEKSQMMTENLTTIDSCEPLRKKQKREIFDKLEKKQ